MNRVYSGHFLFLSLVCTLQIYSAFAQQAADSPNLAPPLNPLSNPLPLPETPPADANEAFEKIRFTYPTATFTYAIKPELRITGLKWVSEPPPLKPDSTNENNFYIEFVGNYQRANWLLFVTTEGVEGSQSVVQNSTGDFKIKVPMNHETVGADLLAVGPNGEIEKETVIGFFKNLEGFKKFKRDEKKKSATIPATNLPSAANSQSAFIISASNPKYSLASGLSFAHYKQSFASSVSMLLVSTQAKFTRAIQPEKFDFGGDVNVALPLVFTTGAGKASFLNIAARIGYQVPHSLLPDWPMRIDACTYYDTMKVASTQYGYNNLVGFALSPEIRHAYNSGTLSLFMKFAMSINDFPHSLGSGEYTLGSRWQLRNSTGLGSWGFFANASYLRLAIGEVRISNSTLSLGATLDFK